MRNHNNANYEIKKTINKKIINRKNIEVPVKFSFRFLPAPFHLILTIASCIRVSLFSSSAPGPKLVLSESMRVCEYTIRELTA